MLSSVNSLQLSSSEKALVEERSRVSRWRNNDYGTWSLEDPDYFMCKTCGTHIALQESHDSNEEIEPGVLEGLFLRAVNVEVNDQQRPFARHENHTISDIYCVKCGDILGFKHIQTIVGERIIKSNLAQLRMDKVLLRNRDLKQKKTYHGTSS